MPERTILKYLLIFSLLLAACNPARKLPQGQYLLRKNKIIIQDHLLPSARSARKDHRNSFTISTDDITPYIRQQQNKKQLGTWIRVRIFNTFNKGKETKVKNWFKNTLGSEPIILDTNLTDNSVKQISLYLDNKGFFNSHVLREIHEYKCRKKQVRVKYIIKPASPYYLRNISYSIPDGTLRGMIYSDRPGTLLKTGDQYDVDKLNGERERITGDLNNYGYYYFSQEFIRFQIDTTLGSHEADVLIDIANPSVPCPEKPDSLLPSTHRRYYIKGVFILFDYNPLAGDTVKYDTLQVSIPGRKKGAPPKTYYFVYKDKLRIRPKTLTQQVFIDSGDFYSLKDAEKTHRQLYELKTFRYVSVLFKDISSLTDSLKLLDCQIMLSRLPVQAFAIEAQVTNRGGDLGVAGSLVYENRNLFRGAEIFNMKINGAVEIEKLSFNTKKEDRALKNIPFFNTVEAGTEFNLKLPRFLLPVNQERFSKNFHPKTNIGAGFNYQQRSDYIRYLTRGSFGYEWKESASKTHILTPIEVNAVVINPDSSFAALIDALPDKIAQNAYKNHLVTSLKYSFIYNTQQIGKSANFMYFRGNFEVAGLLFWLYNVAAGKQGSYLLLKTPYSQYTRVDFDYRYYAYLNEKNVIATRAAFGIGAPLDKYNSLPFEKNFYLGGANSMRGWRLRTLGPGGYDEPDTMNFDNIGDISLELNVEYRFPIYKYFKGGLFIDAGNIWLRKKNDFFPGGEFRFDRFYKEIAFNAGLGLRLDLGFFVLRIDGAVPLKNPRMLPDERWVFQGKNKFRILTNFGIGYPF